MRKENTHLETLPNGRTFYARYERIKRRDFPAEIRMKRT